MYFLFLYAMLADPVFETREYASDRLAAMIDRHPATYGPRLHALASQTTEPEIVARVRRPLASYGRWRVANYIPKTAPIWPAIDLLPVATVPFWGPTDLRLEFDETACEWIEQITPEEMEYGRPEDSYPTRGRHRRATATMVADMIRRGATDAELDELIGQMWELEKSAFKTLDRLKEWEGGYPPPR